jgi:hypothetical protein
MLVTWPYLTGALPHHIDRDLGRLAPDAAPAGAHLVRRTVRDWATSSMFVGNGWLAFVRQDSSGRAWLSLSAADAATADPVVAALKAQALPPVAEPDLVELTFVHRGGSASNSQPSERVLARRASQLRHRRASTDRSSDDY